MYASSPIDDNAAALEPIRVAVIALVLTETTRRVIAELQRQAMQVEVAAGEVIGAPPAHPVYVIGVSAAVGEAHAAQIVAWAAAREPRPGLIGVVEEAPAGDPRGAGARPDCEALLAAGFDDAVCAPISPRELAGRVRAVHRRVLWRGPSNGRITYGELTLDLHDHALWIEGQPIALTSTEVAVLRELVRARGRPRSRTELLDVAWGEGDLEVSERAVDNVILRLRRKLPRPELIETVRSVGFRIATREP